MYGTVIDGWPVKCLVRVWQPRRHRIFERRSPGASCPIPSCTVKGAERLTRHQDADRTIPTTMVFSHLLSGSFGLVFVVVYLFCMVDVGAATADEARYPFLFVFRNAFSLAVVNGLTAIVLVLVFAGTLSYNFSSSRQIRAVGSPCRKRSSTPLTSHSLLAMEASHFPRG